MQPLLCETVWERDGSTSLPFPHCDCVTASLRHCVQQPLSSGCHLASQTRRSQIQPPRCLRSSPSSTPTSCPSYCPSHPRCTHVLHLMVLPSAVFSLLLPPAVPCSLILSSERQKPDPFTRTVQIHFCSSFVDFLSVALLFCRIVSVLLFFLLYFPYSLL